MKGLKIYFSSSREESYGSGRDPITGEKVTDETRERMLAQEQVAAEERQLTEGISVTMDAITTGDMLYLDNGGATMTGDGKFINCNDDDERSIAI